MNPHPGNNSVLVMDNANIHYYYEMINVIRSVNCRALFFPPILNPIELAKKFD
jgi:hypothetical protein